MLLPSRDWNLMNAKRKYTHSAIQICVITALLLVPMKDFIFRFCLIHLKNNSTCQRAR